MHTLYITWRRFTKRLSRKGDTLCEMYKWIHRITVQSVFCIAGIEYFDPFHLIITYIKRSRDQEMYTTYITWRRCTKRLSRKGDTLCEMYKWIHRITVQSVFCIVGIASCNPFHLTIKYIKHITPSLQCKESDMPSTVWSTLCESVVPAKSYNVTPDICKFSRD